MNCIDIAITTAKGRLITSEIDDLIGEIDRIKEALRLSGKTDNLDQRALTIARSRAVEKQVEAARMKRQVAQNIKARAALDTQLALFRSAGLSPLKSLLALHEGSQRAIKGARASSYAQGQAYEARWMGSLFANVQRERPHLLRLMSNRSFDDAVTRELWELRDGGKPGSTGSKDAQWFARELAAHMEMSRTELNRLGAAIGKLDGYAGPQVHDDIAMLRAGREAWVRDVQSRLDIERSFPDAADEAEVRDILTSVYDTIVTGVSRSETSPLLTGKRIGPANLAKKMGAHRVLHFRDAEAALSYRDLYGRGSTIQGVLGQMRHHAHYAGVMDRFGPNPKVMMNSLAARMQQDLRAEAAKTTDPKELARIQKQIEQISASDGQIARLQATIDDMTGVSSRPVSTTAAAIGGNIRAVQQMAKLGGAVLSSIPSDTVTAAAAAMNRGQGFWRGMFDTMAEMFNRRGGKEIGFLLGEGFDGIIGHVSSAAVPFDTAPGAISRATTTFFKWSGLSGWTDTIRAASARVIAAHLGYNAGKGWAKLDASLQHVLKLNGIDEVKWEAIRKAGFREGPHYITPDSIRSLGDDVIEPIVADQIAEAQSSLKPQAFEAKRQRLIEDARRDLELDLHRYYADETSYAVIESDAATRRMITRGYRPGTVAGEVIRFIMQFKAFPVAFSQRVLGRAVFNAPKGATTQVAHIGATLAGLTVAGYMSILMKDAARGLWPPRDPFSPKTWGAAMLQGGALGIYGDFLFGQRSRFGQGPIETLSGPFVGTMGDLWSLYQGARDGDPDAGKALDVLVQNTPYANLFFVRPALDYLFINDLREIVRPGYRRRQERRLREERGQEFFLPRSLGATLQ